MGTLRIGGTPFSPLDVTTGAARFWYDFSDKTTMFQDEARTMPVVSDGDEIHAMTNKFDISGLGPFTNGEPYATRHTPAGNRAIWRDASSDPNMTDSNVHGDFTANTPTTGLRASTGGTSVMTDNSDTWTAFAVFPVTPIGGSSVARRTAFTGMTNGGNFMGVFGVNAENNEIGIRCGSTFRRSPTLDLSGPDNNKWIQQTVVVDSTSPGTILRWRLNGVDDSGNLTGTTGVGTFTWRLGLEMANRTPFDWQGNLGEIIVFKDQVSDSEIASMEGYLASKWNLSTI